MKNPDHIDQPDHPTPDSTQDEPASPLVTFDLDRMVITLSPEAMQGLAALQRGAEAFAHGIVQVADAALPYVHGIVRLTEAAVRAARPVIEHVHQQLAPTILRWGLLLDEAAAAAVRLAPRVYAWGMRLKELHENAPFIYCALTERALREENDLATLQHFATNVLGLKVARSQLFFVAEALVLEPWAEKSDPIGYLRTVVNLSLRLARNPEADPHSPQYLPRNQRRRGGAPRFSFVSLDQDDSGLLDSEDYRAQYAIDEALILHNLARTELRPEAQQLLRLRLNGCGKAEAAQLMGWSMTVVERYWKEIERAEPHLRHRLLS